MISSLVARTHLPASTFKQLAPSSFSRHFSSKYTGKYQFPCLEKTFESLQLHTGSDYLTTTGITQAVAQEVCSSTKTDRAISEVIANVLGRMTTLRSWDQMRIAMESNLEKALRTFQQKKAPVTAEFFQKLTPLTKTPPNRCPETALLKNENHFGWVEVFTSLLELENDTDFSTLDSETVDKVHRAFDQFFDSMIQFGFDVNKPLVWNLHPIHRAAETGCLMTLQSLIRKEADVNRSSGGDTPLYIAALKDKIEAAKILICAGADVKGSDSRMIPLHIATSPRMCTLLVKNGCSVNSRSKIVFHESALHWNVHCSRPDTILSLLKLGAKVFNDLEEESALVVAHKVHNRDYSVMMGNPYNPVITRLIIDLLTNAAQGNIIFPRTGKY
jgi:hypothetical protein